MGSQPSFEAPPTRPTVATGTTRKRTAAMVARISGVPFSLSWSRTPGALLLGLLVMLCETPPGGNEGPLGVFGDCPARLCGVPLEVLGDATMLPEGTHGSGTGAAIDVGSWGTVELLLLLLLLLAAGLGVLRDAKLAPKTRV